MSTTLPDHRSYSAPWNTAGTVELSATRQLRAVVISAVFPPEFTFSATTSQAVAKELVSRGHAVIVLAPFPNKPAGKLFPGYRRRLYSRQQIPQEYTLVHCFGTLAPKSRMIPRLLENVSFGITAGTWLLFCQRPDVVYSNAWPIFATVIILAVAKLRGIPVVVSVQDVYPESLVAQGRTVRRGLVFRAIQAIDTWIANSAKALIVISEQFHEIYRTTRTVPGAKLHVVPNWGERDALHIDPSVVRQFREAKGIPQDAFVAVYAGNVGPASGAEGLVEAFGKVKYLRNTYLLIAGSGSNLESCIARARALGLDRVIFHSPWKHEETGAVLGLADVLLLPTVGNQSLASVPSKLVSYLLAGRPVLAMVLPESETARAISAAGAGWMLPPGEPEALAAAIRAIVDLPGDELRRRGSAGKAFANNHLCRESNLPKVIGVLESAARRKH